MTLVTRPFSLSFSRTETGSVLSVQRQTQTGGAINARIAVTKNEDETTTVSKTRTGRTGESRSIEKTHTPEQIHSFAENLHALGEKLAADPVTLRNGRVLDGHILLKIDPDA